MYECYTLNGPVKLDSHREGVVHTNMHLSLHTSASRLYKGDADITNIYICMNYARDQQRTNCRVQRLRLVSSFLCELGLI